MVIMPNAGYFGRTRAKRKTDNWRNLEVKILLRELHRELEIKSNNAETCTNIQNAGANLKDMQYSNTLLAPDEPFTAAAAG